MDANSGQRRDLAAAQRGLIVQRVLVEGLTPGEAGAPFGVEEPVVARWVAAYRRHGMASLRGSGAFDEAPRRWIERWLLGIGAWLHGGAHRPTPRPAEGSGATIERWRRY